MVAKNGAGTTDLPVTADAPAPPTITVEFRPAGPGAFNGEILQGPEQLSHRDQLIAGLHLAYGLERNARTETEWREAFRVWLTSVVRWMQAEDFPVELLSLAAQLNGHLEDLENGRQVARLTAVPRDAAGNPSAGHVAVTRPATACAMVDFLVAELPDAKVSKIEDRVAGAIGWKPKQFRHWRKKFNAEAKGARAQRIYSIALTQARRSRGTKSPQEIAEILLRVSRAYGA